MDEIEENSKIINVDLEKEMKKSFLDYSMSVIVQRALPDVRDGLKPVHRRILYTMFENGLSPEKAYRKCADTVGSVLGRYHPHGDASVYDALVRLAQNFSMRYHAGGRPRQLRFRRRRSAGCLPLHRSPHEQGRRRNAAGYRQGYRRFSAELRRPPERADGSAEPFPEPAGQRFHRHRRRHGDEHPAAQHERSHRRRLHAHRQPGRDARRADAVH